MAGSTPEVVGRRRSGASLPSSGSSFEPRRGLSALLQPPLVVVEDEGGRGSLLDVAVVHEVAGSAVSTEVAGVNVSRRTARRSCIGPVGRRGRGQWGSGSLWVGLVWSEAALDEIRHCRPTSELHGEGEEEEGEGGRLLLVPLFPWVLFVVVRRPRGQGHLPTELSPRLQVFGVLAYPPASPRRSSVSSTPSSRPLRL